MKWPTDKQIQEFWERSGFKRLPWGKKDYHYEGTTKTMNWTHPLLEYGSLDFLPRIDPNNLLAYAMPEGWQQIIFQPDRYCGLTVNDVLFEGEGDTPGDALFQAIYKALGGKK